MRRWCLLALIPVLAGSLVGQQPKVFTHADTLRGTVTPQRAWWDVAFYDLDVTIRPADSSITGVNVIRYRVKGPAKEMQLDLQVPLEVDSMVQEGRHVRFRRDGNAFFATLVSPQRVGSEKAITVYYHGKPRPAKRPPWDGGFTWVKDSLSRPWIVTSNQGLGASVWWPNKDSQTDEPDSQRVAITVPDPLMNVSNGRLRRVTHHADGTSTWEWFIRNPINNYDIAVSAGYYAHYSDQYQGENGPLTMDFFPLDYHVAAAQRTFPQAREMLQCFEHWFGPYPWYEDGYKLIESPHNGMEHQSAVAYGNDYANGYKGRDASGTGLGMKWDFIIVHESAHEWFGNNITSNDVADMWVHESFANYAEGLFTECKFGKKSGEDYIIGNRRGIRNDTPVQGAFGVQSQGSGDMYPKGGNMLHTIRHIINNDDKWLAILRGLNQTFWHQTVSGAQIQNYISTQSGINLSKVFEQYLTTIQIPVFEYRIAGTTLSYRWSNVVPGFDMPLPVTTADSSFTVVHPSADWQTVAVSLSTPAAFAVDRNFYVKVKDVGATAP
ncbi:MAG: M1 family metallopeptidase [Gemmatimonadales bacterium]